MAIAYHIIFSCYGFWLPNDPRGSWSDFVGKWELFKFGGPAKKPETSGSVAGVPHDHAVRIKAKRLLNYPPVILTGKQALSTARGLEMAVQESDYSIYACSILPEHVHVVIGLHRKSAGQIVGHLKARAGKFIRMDCGWPTERPVWTEGYWTAYLDNPEDVFRAISYVEANPVKEGKQAQHWEFVRTFTC